ncbi:MAG TPA: hypothetical protein PKD73_06000 [Burkholderiaceae bacterium]|nr:hypothetical protein [Burkholderiaceae bacterium]
MRLPAFAALNWPSGGLLLAVALLAGAGGWHFGSLRATHKLDALKTDIAQREANAADAAHERLLESQARAALLVGQVAAQQAQINSQSFGALHVLAKVASPARPAYSSPVVRVLATAPGVTVAMPEPAAGAAAKDGAAGAAAAEPPGAESPERPELMVSELDAATWAIHAAGLYETCRARLGALVDFHVGAGR